MSALAAVCDGLAGCWLDPHKAQGARDPRRCLFYSAPKLIVDRKKSFPLGKSCKVVGIGAIEGADGGALAGEKDGGRDEGGPREEQRARDPRSRLFKTVLKIIVGRIQVNSPEKILQSCGSWSH